MKNSDVGKIALVNTPGLGDFKLGDKEIMLETLGREVDVVLFIVYPNSPRDQWKTEHTELYDMAAKELNNLAERSFIILNHSKGTDSDKSCQNLKQTLPMKVAGCEITNCSIPEEANQVLDRVLDYLTEHISELDEAYAQQSQARVIELQQKIQRLQPLTKAACGITANSSGAIDDRFDDLFGTDQDGWWRDMTIAFQDLRFESAEQCRLPSVGLESGIAEVYSTCKSAAGILTEDNPTVKIQEQIKASNPMKAYADYRDQLRTLLSDHFSHLDGGLKQTTQDVKARVAKILIEVGQLGIIAPGLDGAEFLKAFREIVDRDHPDLKRLQQGLSIIGEFELSYTGLIEPQIYQHVVDLSNIQLSHEKEPTLKVGQHTPAALILEALKIDYDRTTPRIKAALEELLYQPSTAVYARIEKLIDNIIYHKEAQKDWKKFLRRVRSQVWAQDIGKLEQEHRLRQEWQATIAHLEAINRVEALQFLP